jgi:hypothetical protein
MADELEKLGSATNTATASLRGKETPVLIPVVLRKIAQPRGGVDVLDYQNYLEVWNHARSLKNHKRNPIMMHDEKTLEFYLAAVSPA